MIVSRQHLTNTSRRISWLVERRNVEINLCLVLECYWKQLLTLSRARHTYIYMFTMLFQTATLCWFLVTVASVPSSSKSNEDFDLNIVEQGTHFTEKVEVDVERNVEEIEVPPHNDVMGAKYIHDFNRNLTLRLTTGSEHCFLQDLSRAIQDGYAVQPRELLGALRHAQDQSPENGVTIVVNHWTIGDRVREEDVSLSAEMNRLCLGRAIYWLHHMDDSVSVGSHQSHESRLIRHKRQSDGDITPQCTQLNLKYRCKREIINCAYLYYENCEAERVNVVRRRAHCADKNTLHIFDEVKCCRECCADENQAGDFFPFCDELGEFDCYGE